MSRQWLDPSEIHYYFESVVSDWILTQSSCRSGYAVPLPATGKREGCTPAGTPTPVQLPCAKELVRHARNCPDASAAGGDPPARRAGPAPVPALLHRPGRHPQLQGALLLLRRIRPVHAAGARV